MIDALLATGYSGAARYVQEATYEVRDGLHESIALGIGATVSDELATVWEDCREPNWDGYGALPVTKECLRNTNNLLKSLPYGFPPPSVGAEPDGQLTLEWHRSQRHTLSVSVSPNGNLHYAALFGPNREFGTEAFFGEVPEKILGLVRRVCPT